MAAGSDPDGGADRGVRDSGQPDAQHRMTMREALAEAIEFADEGWAYADVYFQEKWDYKGQRARLIQVLKDTDAQDVSS